MPTLEEALDATTVANIGHIYYAPVGTEIPDLSTFTFDGKDWSGWKWLGDTSAENLPEFEEDDDDDSTKRTWDRLNTRSNGKITGTINGVAITREFMEATKSGGISDAAGYTTTNRTSSKSWAVLIVVEDGAYVTGLAFFVATLKSGLPAHDLENYTEVPVNVVAQYDSEGRIYKVLYPVKRANPGQPEAIPGD